MYRKELVSPEGERYVSTSAVETNDLIYGSGFREATDVAPEPTKPAAPTVDKPAEPRPSTGGEVTP